jgi:glycosyltransferase involved in cell wall biosynthesis
VAEWPFPLADPAHPGNPPRYPEKWAHWTVPVRRAVARLARRRRLAVVDTHFPWKISGFRYHEAEALLRLRPDTMFFSLYRCTDPFPAPVYALEDFPTIAPAAGVTDVYAVFLNLASSILGIEATPGLSGTPGARNDISIRPVLERFGIRVHVTVYPGGGWTPNVNPEVVREVGRRCATVFSNIPGIDELLPDVVRVTAPLPCDFYRWRERGNRDRREPLRLVFAGDDQPRKGLATLLAACEMLGPKYPLTVVGPHDRFAGRMAALGATRHGWLSPEGLRDLVSTADVVVSPATHDLPTDGYGDTGLADGFPTVATAVAMLTGCAMVGSNPIGDHFLLRRGHDYIEVPERDPAALAVAIENLHADRDHLARLARTGAATLRERADAVAVASSKLAHMGLADAPVRNPN